MHPAYSVIFFTTASGAGFGLLALLGLVGFNHGQASSFAFAAASIAIAYGLIVFGLLSSSLHLGRPERAWRAFSQWRSSWLSREGIVSVATFVPASAFALVWSGLLPWPWAIGVLGILTCLLCVASVVCTAKIYSTLTTIRAWHQPLTLPVYLAFALATGAPLLMAIASAFGRYQIFQTILAALALAAALVLKLIYWRAIDGAERSFTIESATGLGQIGKNVRQWELAHTSTNFIMKEMGYAVARKHAEKLRNLVMILLAAAAVASLVSYFAPVVFAVVATSFAFAAALVERWLFFAEAQHVVSLYYGAKAA